VSGNPHPIRTHPLAKILIKSEFTLHNAELVICAIRSSLAVAGLESGNITSGVPWKNGYVESFNSKNRDELLNAEEFGRVLEARLLTREWRNEYNHVRRLGSLVCRTPAEL
jgi:putative transposase